MADFLEDLYPAGPRRRKRRPLPPAVDDESLPCVIFYINRCPHCGSINHHVYSTKGGGVRHHICDTCGKTFKSIEKIVQN